MVLHGKAWLMNYRIEISPLPQWRDARGEGVKKQIEKFYGFPVEQVRTRDVYTVVADITEKEAQKVAALLYNPVLQGWRVTAAKSENFQELPECDFLVAVGFRPGVTDNVGRSAKSAVGDILGRKLGENEVVFSSTEYLFYGRDLTREQAQAIASKLLANELIQTVCVLSGEEVSDGIPMNLPFVTGVDNVKVREYDLEVPDEKLMEISRHGILALSLEEMKAIQNYFRNAKNREAYGLGRNPTDVELEVIAQTWSEHCKHKIFSAKIDYENLENGEKQEIVSCYKTFIQKSTREIAGQVFSQIFTAFHPEIFFDFVAGYRWVVLLMAVGYVLHFASARVEAGTMRLVQRMPIVLYAVMMTALIWLIMQMRNGDVQPFIYFQF